MESVQKHKELKHNDYWDTLITRETFGYREAMIKELLSNHFPSTCSSIMDVGIGTDTTLPEYQKLLNAQVAIGIDYDESKVKEMQTKLPEVQWHVQDIFHLESWQDPQDLIFLKDCVHELYSFYGRDGKSQDHPISHDVGLKHVQDALTNLVNILAPGGGIVITDNVLCEYNDDVIVQMNSDEVIQAVQHFLKDYPTKDIKAHINENKLTMNARDFCILLTQYNKIKQNKMDRWSIERLETHQYLSAKEFEGLFDLLACDMHAIIGTPKDAWREWNEDFTMLQGLDAIPEKRISLLAIKR